MNRSVIFLFAFSLLLLAAISGCVTSDEVKYISRSLDSKISAVQGNVDRLQKTVAENNSLINQSDELNRSLRKNQADTGADIIHLRNEVQSLRGAVEEMQVKMRGLSITSTDTRSTEERLNLTEIEARIRVLEERLKINNQRAAISSSAKKGTVPSSPVLAEEEKPDSEKLYSDAYQIFVNRDYEEARAKFLTFLKNYPDTEYSDNAQFWIAECFYFQDKYEEAILEYEKVIQNYPKGNKVPNALLKQALSFLKLEDTSSSQLLLQRVVKEYPGTTPAEIARSKLQEIK
ncbi:MAG: tol-pal system protein YbgF [Syntrophales bacterium]|nr:tol-pal system protein YbgF [Syntrophales bacterium]MDY0044558.1 tol-pal system protein YbgF [Syntrophales bacterium]